MITMCTIRSLVSVVTPPMPQHPPLDRFAAIADPPGSSCGFRPQASSVGLSDVGKRLLLGRKLRSTQLGESLLPKRIALPVFATDALSSVAYAPDEILLTLSLA